MSTLITLPTPVLRCAVRCAAKNDARRYLNGVHLRADADGLIVEATAGTYYIGIRCHAQMIEPPQSLILDASSLTTALRALGCRSIMCSLRCDDMGAWTISEGQVCVGVCTIQEKYPDTTARLLDLAACENGEQMWVDADYMALIMDGAARLSPGKRCARVCCLGASAAGMRWSVEAQDAQAVIILAPLRQRPEWRRGEDVLCAVRGGTQSVIKDAA